jgi:hypothetical protein
MLNYDDEHWIKVYTRDTAGWLAVSWQARGLALEIARKLPKKTGELSLGRRGLEALAGLLRAPWPEIEPFVNELIADGRLEYDPERQVIRDPGHIIRQSAVTSPAERKRRQREIEAANDVGHAMSRDVTPSHQEKRREEKREEEKRNTPHSPPPGGEGPADQIHAHYVQTLKAIRPRRRPPRLSPKDRKRIEEHLRSGLTVDDLKRAVEGLMRSPHHLGENDRHTEYLELEYALRKPGQMAALVPEEAPSAVRRAVKPAEPGVPPPPGVLEAIEQFIAGTGT